MKKQILRVGFDLDGVLLYNPARIYRPIISWVKKNILKRDTTRFYYPKNKVEQLIWSFLHKSSLWPAPGIRQLAELIREKRVKAYIISARYESLKSDFNSWTKKIDPERIFSGYYYNDNNEQPHLFKEKMIKKLNLDIFVDDNWDIVVYLRDKCKVQNSKFKVYWIYNVLDMKIKHHYKFSSLKQIIKALSS